MLLRRKFLLINGSVAVLAAAALYYAYASTLTVASQYDEVSEHNLPIVTALHDIRAAAIGIAATSSELASLAAMVSANAAPGTVPAAVGREERSELRDRVAAFENALASYAYVVATAPGHGHDEGQVIEDIGRKGQALIEAGRALQALSGRGAPWAGSSWRPGSV